MAIQRTRPRTRCGSTRQAPYTVRIDIDPIRRITILPAYHTVRFSPGSQISFRAADQSGNDVTQLLTWESGDPQRLRAEQGMPGVFTPLSPGRAEIHAYHKDSRGPIGETVVMIQSTRQEAA
ncbi:MAG TPA: hypothetical protein VH877_12840 [Polyangia bacterium]|jgi:hypothetical protein|nr:hypothetical protein [Polyangia bacterium]